jgi:ATP adenylyltransferase
MPQRKSDARETLLLEPGTLWAKVTQRTEHALHCGALQPIPTECKLVEQDGVNFLVRVLPNLARKEEAKKKQEQETTTSGKEFNPFLPYEEDLFVADISDTHLCLLNKFNVIDHHLLIVTREFEEQDTLLTLQDFAAMWACLAEIDGLVFYNAGKTAGASQRHKHLQLVPLPLVPDGLQVPIASLFPSIQYQETMGTIPGFPFAHGIALCSGQRDTNSTVQNAIAQPDPLEAASSTLELYYTLLDALGLMSGEQENSHRPLGAYNLLATREWMLIVPRSLESFESIPVNSLGFAGTLAVRSEQQMKFLVEQGPMTVLKNVAVPTTTL